QHRQLSIQSGFHLALGRRTMIGTGGEATGGVIPALLRNVLRFQDLDGSTEKSGPGIKLRSGTRPIGISLASCKVADERRRASLSNRSTHSAIASRLRNHN